MTVADKTPAEHLGNAHSFFLVGTEAGRRCVSVAIDQNIIYMGTEVCILARSRLAMLAVN